MRFDSLEQMVAAAFEAVRPADQISVTEAAERYHIIRQPGSHNGPWSRDRTPYIVEPQDVLTSLDYTSMIFVGPARTGKSLMLTNWVTHSVKVDPADIMVVHMSQNTAREWVKSDLEKSFRHSPELAAQLSRRRDDDNLFDKQFVSGMRMSVTWPTVRNLSGKTLPRVWLMDYDRMDDDIDKEGSPYDLAKKRTTTFGRFAMTAAESSPGREIADPRWMPRTPHEAPPTTGILGLYNLGDRRRWYWACPECHEAFEPDFPLLHWPDVDDPAEAAEGVYMGCPHCGSVIHPDQKDALNRGGRWVRDGMKWNPATDEMLPIEGVPLARGDIASFWVKGPAAGFQTWQSLVREYLRAEKIYRETGNEEKLKVTTNTDQGLPYISRARLSERLPEEMREKAENWGSTEAEPTVPEGVRFLVATIDVQARSFVVQVHGFTDAGDIVVIDGFKIRVSTRPDGDGAFLPLEPPVFAEDWDLLVEKVIERTYPLADGSGRRMPLRLIGCDSGGVSGSTTQAYNFWRRLRAEGRGLHRRFALVKGNPKPQAPRAYVTWPDSNQTGKKAVAKGDVPVVMLGSNILKDQLAGMVSKRTADGPATGGMIRYPDWMPTWFYSQMTNEVRTARGWENVAKRRNEAWDLAYYAIGLAVRPRDPLAPWPTIEFEKIDWTQPPLWAEEWDTNPDIIRPDAPPPVAAAEERPTSLFARLGAKLA